MCIGQGPPPELRLGLSLAGAVSGGTFSAGVLDYLVEALDAWQDARALGDPAAPDHDVILEAIAGASAGAYAASLLAIGLRSRFPHVSLAAYGSEPSTATDNPLFDAWVQGTGIQDLLGTRDGCENGFTSLLDATRIDEVAVEALKTPGSVAQVPGPGRCWVADPLRVAITVTNLEGVPLALEGTSAPRAPDAVRHHADVLRFALTELGGARCRAPAHDEAVLAYPAEPARLSLDWMTLVQAATASAAVPLALPARVVEWGTSTWRPVHVAWPPGIAAPEKASFQPLWPKQVPHKLSFVAVDGGFLDNDPIAIVGDDLRAGSPHLDADHRALLMIHPLLDKPAVQRPPTPEPDARTPWSVLRQMASALVEQARGSLVDVALAQREDCYGRYLIVPVAMPGATGPARSPLAGAFLGAFGGYLHEDYRRHDWQLGRANAQHALQHHLTLPEDHDLFRKWTCQQKEAHRVVTPNGRELPIIPLMPALRSLTEPVLPWPAGRKPAAGLGNAVDARLLVVVKGLLKLYLPGSRVWRFLLLLLWRLLGAKRARGYVMKMFDKGVAGHQL